MACVASSWKPAGLDATRAPTRDGEEDHDHALPGCCHAQLAEPAAGDPAGTLGTVMLLGALSPGPTVATAREQSSEDARPEVAGTGTTTMWDLVVMPMISIGELPTAFF